MEKKPKTKEVVRTVKEHAVGAVKDKVSQVGVKTKEAVTNKAEEQLKPQQGKKGEQSPESYASDQVTETGERLADDAVYVGDRAVKGTVRHIKKKRNEKKDARQEADAPEETEPDSSQSTSGGNDEPTSKAHDEVQSPESSERQHSKPSKSDSPQKKEQTTKAPSDTPTEPERTEKPTNKSDRKSVKTTQKKQSDPDASPESPFADTATAAKKQTAKTPEQQVKSKERTVKKPVAKDNVSVTESEKNTIRRKTPEQAAIKERTQAAPKTPFASDTPERDMKPRTKQKSLPKQRGQQTIKHAGTRANEFRTAASASNKVKEVQRGTKQTIKKADKTVKNAERTAKATKKAAETTAKAAKRSEEAARRTAKAAIHATKVAVKAAIEGIKAAIAAGKELIAAIGAGGPVVLVIIIVICLIAAVGGTCFGIFLSNDKTTGTKITMPEAISQLTAEHYSDLTELKSKYTYDTMEVEGGASMAINWKDVLAVYAVKTTTSTENAYEVVTMDDVKMNLLRDVISDMNKFMCVVVPTVVSEIVTETDEHGNTVTTTKYVTKNILKVTVIRLTVDQIIEQYHFNEEQKKQLTELMRPDYDDLWQNIIGTTGDILITNSTYIPTDIFAWPLQDNGSITSGYGYRHDPKTGEWKLHGGTDIAAPTGTPILASADGVVIAAQWHNSYGYYVKIQHNDTFATLYGHCSALHVTAGQQVKQGQIIADVGQTGYATGPHVHFEVYINGTRVDATQYFK